MKAVLTNIGSTGDIYPFIALAAELRRAGHAVVVGLSPVFAAQARRWELSFAPVGPDIQAALEEMIAARVEMPGFFRSVDDIRTFFAPVAAALPHMFEDLRALCRDADILIAGPSQPAARMIHELAGLPFAMLSPAPPGASTEPALQQARLAIVNPLRRQHGLPPLHDPATAFTSPQLNLYAISRHVIPRPANWPAHSHLTGYFVFDDANWQPEPALLEFLAAGDAPVVLSFGSMTHDDPAALSDVIIAAVQRVGCRAIIQHGWSKLAARALPANVYGLGFAPHGWLFPQAACVVHHGGAGTTAAVFRAGVPHVVVPHLADQPIWAEVARALGCAGPALPYAELTAGRLAEAIAATLAAPEYRRAAGALAERIRPEQGLSRARELIEDLLKHSGLHGSAEGSRQLPDVAAETQARMSRRKQYQQRRRTQGQDDE